MAKSVLAMRQNKGFSLLEILVAFSIMAVALGIILTVFSQGLNKASLSEDYNIATQLAESLLAKTGVETKLQSGRQQGTELDKYRWTIKIDELNESDGLEQSIRLMRVKVVVQWGDEDRGVALMQLKTRGFVDEQ
jgi:general secretion pathway protein I